jgi:HD-GYP domain-containing protein (c-di-GMP phosphodiesterase class II)
MNGDAEAKIESRRGQQLAMVFASGLRTAGYYDPGNSVMQQACAALYSRLTEYTEEQGSVSFRVHSHCVFVGKARIPTSVSTYARFSYLIQLFEDWGINTLTFSAGLTEEELVGALILIARTRPGETGDLAGLLRSAGIQRVNPEMVAAGTGRQTKALSPVVAYSAAMQLGAELGNTVGPLEARTVRRARHVTQAVVDEILRDPASLLTLTTIKDFDQYLILHSTNVAVLSTVLGQRIGLAKPALGELCLAGFLHDAGKLGVDPDVLSKPGALNADEWQQMRRHPVLAARALLGGQRLAESDMRAVVVAFEHHLNYDLSGYPPTEIKKEITLFGGIVSIADRFDALTTARIYRKVNLTPPEAMVIVTQGSGKHFDPILVKLFVEVMGIYPTGTVVVLSRGEAGVVCRPPAVGTPLDRPQVRVIVGGEPGVGAEPGTVVDLQERVDGEYARNILGVLNPSNQGQIPAVDPGIFASL